MAMQAHEPVWSPATVPSPLPLRQELRLEAEQFWITRIDDTAHPGDIGEPKFSTRAKLTIRGRRFPSGSGRGSGGSTRK